MVAPSFDRILSFSMCTPLLFKVCSSSLISSWQFSISSSNSWILFSYSYINALSLSLLVRDSDCFSPWASPSSYLSTLPTSESSSVRGGPSWVSRCSLLTLRSSFRYLSLKEYSPFSILFKERTECRYLEIRSKNRCSFYTWSGCFWIDLRKSCSIRENFLGSTTNLSFSKLSKSWSRCLPSLRACNFSLW